MQTVVYITAVQLQWGTASIEPWKFVQLTLQNLSESLLVKNKYLQGQMYLAIQKSSEKKENIYKKTIIIDNKP